MRTKNVLIIIIIAVILLVCGVASYMLLSNTSYKNITIDGITMEVPDSNTTVINQTDLYHVYNDTENQITIIEFNSTNAGLNDLSEAATFAAIREINQVDAKIQDNNIYHTITLKH